LEVLSSVRIGTSGWSYKEWEKVFYPDSKTPKLSFYSSVFDTAEIDSTFYANPSKGFVFGWARNTPKSFVFSVKLPKKITHEKKMDLNLGVEIDLDEFLQLLGPLKDSGKLGPLLIQLPPSFHSKQAKTLEDFFDVLPKGYSFAVEFRNKSWLKYPGLYTLLMKYNVANTIVDEPLLPADLTVTSEDFAFVRWHGKGTSPWYNYRYDKEEIDPWIEKVEQVAKKTKRVFGYFNNHFHGFAIENGLYFLDKLGIATDMQKETYHRVHEYLNKSSMPVDSTLD
jgi:uncharacterized protein YecE (DUF72 family)